jgi:serine protease inhibitor
MRGTPSLPLLLALGLGLAACAESPTAPGQPGPIDRLPRDLSAAEAELIRANNGFAFDLLREVSAAAPDSNVFLSPLSASIALGMTMNGAAGSTLDAMRGTLGFGDLPLQDINVSYRNLMALLLGLDRTIETGIANSIWYRQGEVFQDVFLRDVRDYFGARVEALDFGDPRSPDVINAWVEAQTRSRIPRIVESIRGDDIMFLINAVYFKAPWAHRFDPANTRDAAFHLADGSTAHVRLMNRSGPLTQVQHERATIVELPYGGGAYGMIIVLPNHGTSVASLVRDLDGATWSSWMAALGDPTDGHIALPRFRLEYEATLNRPLEGLGMGIAFSGAADFSRMQPDGGLFISRVKQKTFLDVDEEGTEAAAVTKVVMGRTSAPGAVVVDRPFILAIREQHSGTIVFMGAVMDPR